jgi:signal transduction histidine kinase
MLDRILALIDWFIPESGKVDRSDLALARNFVFTHLFGPLLAQSISVFVYLLDPDPGWACWTIIVCIWSFWLLPFLYKYWNSLTAVALISVQVLAFSSLFGSFHYGGVSSPFMPWLIVSLLLGFFYLSDRPILVIGMFSLNLAAFVGAYAALGSFPERVPLNELAPLGWISIASATVYMTWMAIYYTNITAMRSELEKEAARHRATALRLRRAKYFAERANRAKSIFLAKMSHEFRTPLNAVIGYSEMILETCEPSSASQSKMTDLKRINAAGKHLLSLLTDVLDLSKIESDKMDLSISTFEIPDFVEDVVATAQPLVTKNGNRFIVKCPDDVGAITTDATKLRQATLNLLSNAAKFTSEGTVTLDVRRDAKAAGDWIEIRVKDTGIGIGEADLRNLFRDYGQAPSTSRVYGGTGLGLALSQKLCALMGGGISVVSQPNRGSCFSIRIPAVVIPNEEACPDDAAGATASYSPIAA